MGMKKILLPLFVLAVFVVVVLYGVVPQKWEIQNKDDFLKGKLEGVSVSYDGVVSLSPKEEKMDAPVEEFYLSLLITSRRELFLGTGHSGRIYRIGRDGETELYFQVPEMDVFCLAQDKGGNLYAGSSPNGKIYKITEKGKGSAFFDPREKYIWDLTFVDPGVLLAAVGESGGIYEINMEGQGVPVLRSEENHVLCVRVDTNKDLIAGTGGRGCVYRIRKGRKPSILFEAPYEEIRSVALDNEGNIYAAAGGKITSLVKVTGLPETVRAESDISVTVTPPSVQTPEVLSLSQEQPGALFKISPGGIPKNIWRSDDELIYSLLWDEPEKMLYFGTGDKGRVYSVDRNEKISLLIQKPSAQVYSLSSSNQKIYVLSNNPSDLSIIHSEQVLEGEYLSQVIDTQTVSSWGRMEWDADIPSGCNLQFQTRSGYSRRPGVTWSDWSPPYQKKEGERILSPKGRYLQVKVMFKTRSGRVSPILRRVSLFYLQTNLAPKISSLTLLPVNTVYLKPPLQTEVVWGMDTDVSTEKARSEEEAKALTVPKKVEKKGFQTAVWEASDENGDSLQYTISIKEENEDRWRVLKENWIDTIYAFETLSFPDGVYVLKVEALDVPSNPSGTELKTEKISRPLIIDNSLPVIKDFKASKERNKLVITFVAEDSMSPIQEVKFLIRPDEWKSIFPQDGICDSKKESFNISVDLSSRSDNMITVKVQDRHGNIGVHRQTF